MKLRRDASSLVGRYFLEQRGEDVQVQGTVDDKNHTFLLGEVEGQGKALGTIESDGSLTGSWSRQGTTKPLHVRPVVPRLAYSPSPIPIFEKRIEVLKSNAKPGQPPVCKINHRYLETVGGFAEDREESVNRELAPNPKFTECGDRPFVESSSKLHLNAYGALSVEISGYHRALEGERAGDYAATEPIIAYRNIAVPSGADIKLEDILVSGAGPKFQKLLEPEIFKKMSEPGVPPATVAAEVASLVERFDLPRVSFFVEEKGLHVTVWGLPQAYQALSVEGFFLPFDLLRSADLLAPDGPLAHLVEHAAEGVAPPPSAAVPVK